MRRVTVILLLVVAMLPGCGSGGRGEQSAQQTASVAQVPQTTPVANSTTIEQPVATIALPMPVESAPPATYTYPPIPTEPSGLITELTSRPQGPNPIQPEPAPGEAPKVGSLAPKFELLDARTGRSFSLLSLTGKPIFLNFWGTWCPPCRTEMPEMQKMHEKYKGQVEIIGISMGPRDAPDIVESYVVQQEYGWTFVHDAEFEVAERYQAFSVPTSYFIDKEGVISAVYIGAMSNAQMEGYLQQIITK